MSGWISASYDFGQPAKVFAVSCRTALGRRFHDALNNIEVAKLVENVQKLVAESRPDLAGCVIYHIGYNPCRIRWEISIAHNSFPPVTPGYELPIESLEPCPVCKKSLIRERESALGWHEMLPNGELIMVCGEDCWNRLKQEIAEHDRGPAPIVVGR